MVEVKLNTFFGLMLAILIKPIPINAPLISAGRGDEGKGGVGRQLPDGPVIVETVHTHTWTGTRCVVLYEITCTFARYQVPSTGTGTWSWTSDSRGLGCSGLGL